MAHCGTDLPPTWGCHGSEFLQKNIHEEGRDGGAGVGAAVPASHPSEMNPALFLGHHPPEVQICLCVAQRGTSV